MEGYPDWSYIVFGAAVTTSILGAIGLLMRKSWTPMLFMISLVAILINQFYPIVATNYMEVFGSEGIYMPIILTAIGAALLFYAKQCAKKGWFGWSYYVSRAIRSLRHQILRRISRTV